VEYARGRQKTPTPITGQPPAIEGKTWNHPMLVGDILLARNGQEMVVFWLSLAGRRTTAGTAQRRHHVVPVEKQLKVPQTAFVNLFHPLPTPLISETVPG
jgi:hypothetical protein